MTAHPAKLQATLQRSSGECRLTLGNRAGRTELRNFYEQGCAKVRFPRTRRGAPFEAIMINTAGGMTAGDRIGWEFELYPDCNASFTTQACDKIYRCNGSVAKITVGIRVGANSHLAWLPQETILFDGSRLSRHVEIDLAENASLLMCEAVIFGRLGRGEVVRDGEFRDSWQIRRHGRIEHLEAVQICGPMDELLAKAACAGGSGAMATILYAGPVAASKVDEVRKALADKGSCVAGASAWSFGGAERQPGPENGKLLARLIATDGYALRRAMVPALTLLNGVAPLPKSWAI
jgi:urease accessory protein